MATTRDSVYFDDTQVDLSIGFGDTAPLADATTLAGTPWSPGHEMSRSRIVPFERPNNTNVLPVSIITASLAFQGTCGISYSFPVSPEANWATVDG